MPRYQPYNYTNLKHTYTRLSSCIIIIYHIISIIGLYTTFVQGNNWMRLWNILHGCSHIMLQRFARGLTNMHIPNSYMTNYINAIATSYLKHITDLLIYSHLYIIHCDRFYDKGTLQYYCKLIPL